MIAHKHLIQAAYWVGPGKGCFLLSKNWEKRSLPPVRIAGEQLVIQNLQPMQPDDIGVFTGHYEERDSIIFCLDPERHPHVDFKHNPVRVAGIFNNWGRSEDASSFELSASYGPSGRPLYTVAIPRDQIIKDKKEIAFKFVTRSWHWLTPLRCSPNLSKDKSGHLNYTLNFFQTGRHAFTFEVTKERGMDQNATLIWDNDLATPIRPGLFFYDLKSDTECGLLFSANTVTFRLFAPRATRVCLEIHTSTNPKRSRHDLILSNDQVTWEISLTGDLHGSYYSYYVDGPNDKCTTHFDFTLPLLDPYAKATVGPQGPAIILDPAKDHTPNKKYDPPRWEDLNILECHVRDLTQLSPVKLNKNQRQGFTGVTQLLNQKNNYLKEIGVNALEFQPVQQFDSAQTSQYHWGYMTNAYFAPCAWYGTDPLNASQNREFRDMVEACHQNNLSVIIDVVYNHVGEPPNLLSIDKAYYFHLDEAGKLINWSGCGNTLRSESAMSQRLIIESLTHLIEHYAVDGFRFDLAELISIEVLKKIGDALKTIKPSIILIAEPWSFRGSIQWDTRMAGYSYWNDGFREFAREYVLGKSDSATLAYYAEGCIEHMSDWPSQSINYVESHDDRCWIDQITENQDYNGETPTHNDTLRTHMMVALLYTSLGIPLLSSGQDFMRSKKGRNNTYLRGDVNALDYKRIERYQRTHNYFKKWIAFRQSSFGKILRLSKNPKNGYLRFFNCDDDCDSATALLFNADCQLGNTQILLALNPHSKTHRIQLHDLACEDWRPVASIEEFDLNGINDTQLKSREKCIHIEPMNLGLWLRAEEL